MSYNSAPPKSTSSPRWLRGYVRLVVVTFVLAWVSLAASQLSNHGKHMGLLHRNLFVFAGQMPLVGTWPVIAASDSFLSKPLGERETMAREYFERSLRPLATEYYFNIPELRRWFVSSASLTLQEAPVAEWQDPGVPSYRVKYREFSDVAMPRVELWRAFADPGLIAFAAGLATLASALATLAFAAARWVARGFGAQST